MLVGMIEGESISEVLKGVIIMGWILRNVDKVQDSSITNDYFRGHLSYKAAQHDSSHILSLAS